MSERERERERESVSERERERERIFLTEPVFSSRFHLRVLIGQTSTKGRVRIRTIFCLRINPWSSLVGDER